MDSSDLAQACSWPLCILPSHVAVESLVILSPRALQRAFTSCDWPCRLSTVFPQGSYALCKLPTPMDFSPEPGWHWNPSDDQHCACRAPHQHLKLYHQIVSLFPMDSGVDFSWINICLSILYVVMGVFHPPPTQHTFSYPPVTAPTFLGEMSSPSSMKFWWSDQSQLPVRLKWGQLQSPGCSCSCWEKEALSPGLQHSCESLRPTHRQEPRL